MPRDITIPGDRNNLHAIHWGGGGPGLLLLHGLAGHAHWWDACAPRLASAFETVALDFRGHGDSDWSPDGRYGVESFVSDVEAARRALGWERMHLAGHSLGARIACEYAAGHSAVSSLIAVDFTPESIPERFSKFRRATGKAQPFYPDKETICGRFRLEPDGTLLNAAALRSLAELSIRRTEEGWRWKFDWRVFLLHHPPAWDAFPNIRIPTLIVRGEHSPIIDRETMERVVARFENARGIEIPGALHHVPLDAPDLLASNILRFAQNIPAPGR